MIDFYEKSNKQKKIFVFHFYVPKVIISYNTITFYFLSFFSELKF